MNGQQKSLFDFQAPPSDILNPIEIVRQHAQRSPAPAAHGSSTSQEAAAKMTRSGKHASIQARVLGVLRYYRNGLGLTDEEVSQFVTGCRFTSIVSARNSLVKRGLVEDSGNRRLSPTSGMRVTVWRCVR